MASSGFTLDTRSFKAGPTADRVRLAIKERRDGRQAAIPFNGGKRHHSKQLAGEKAISIDEFTRLLAQSHDTEAADYLQQLTHDAGKHERIAVTICDASIGSFGDIPTAELTLTASFSQVITALESVRRHTHSQQHRQLHDLLIGFEATARKLRNLDLEEYDQS
jgi:hypothetical protein